MQSKDHKMQYPDVESFQSKSKGPVVYRKRQKELPCDNDIESYLKMSRDLNRKERECVREREKERERERKRERERERKKEREREREKEKQRETEKKAEKQRNKFERN